MMKKTFKATVFICTFLLASCAFAASQYIVGVVNFANCVMESKYGKHEQEQFEKVRNQWQSLIMETEKELQSLAEKKQDQDYMEGLSPQAIDELNLRFKTLKDDLAKYQSQLYQSLNQANYLFMQKMTKSISDASKTIAQQKNLDLVMNMEACFYNKPNLEITKLVISEMDKTFEKENYKLSENQQPTASKEKVAK